MQVNSVNNQQPTFGMKYVKPRKWDPEILKTLMDSDLAKEIDAKYPKAKAIYEYTCFALGDPLNNIRLTIQLAKDNSMCLFEHFINNKNSFNYKADCECKIKTTTLADIEKACKKAKMLEQAEQAEKENEEQIFARAEAENNKQRTPFQNFICKLFGIE